MAATSRSEVVGGQGRTLSRLTQLARRHPLAAYCARRTGAGLLVAILVSILVFAGTQILPGDAATAILGRTATPASLHALRVQLHLMDPLAQQYWAWFGGLLHGDLGTSLASRQPVSEFIGSRLLNSIVLAGVTIVLLVPLSLLLGTVAGVWRGRMVDDVVTLGTLGAIAFPEFITGTVLVFIFAVSMKVLPAVSIVPAGSNPLTQPSLLVLPVATLLISNLAYTVRMVRAGVVDVMGSEYVQTARLNGIRQRRIISRYVLRNALAPSVQVFALMVQFLVGGVIVVETVFAYPGIGFGLAQAVAARDIPVVQTVATLIAIVYILINIAADILVVLLIPKLRTAS